VTWEASVFDFLAHVAAVELSDAPLVQTVAQVRFNNQNKLSTHSGASAFQEAVLDRYPRLLAESQSRITAGPGNVSADTVPQWRLTDLDNQWACIVGPEQLAIETMAYTTWPSMRDRLNEALKVLGEVASPRIRERVGLRYVNQMPPDDAGRYSGVVDSTLLGLVDQPGWRDALVASLSQTVLREGDLQLAVRYGQGSAAAGVPEGVFVLDIDCSNEKAEPYDATDCMTLFDTLNDIALRCFFALLAEPFRQHLLSRG
jgi:uncharacterized protein (TIGR04255 family)